jgi:hypothetical protein
MSAVHDRASSARALTRRSTARFTLPPLPLGSILPPPWAFRHISTLHGQHHVGRVMVHAFRLIEVTGLHEERLRLWAAVYLHDVARTHDGRCYVHGAAAMRRLEDMPELRALLAGAGIEGADYPAIATAVSLHSRPEELDRDHPHWTLTSLLKDADGLDRVRLLDLDPRYLRWSQPHDMVPFARRLFEASERLQRGRAISASY